MRQKQQTEWDAAATQSKIIINWKTKKNAFRETKKKIEKKRNEINTHRKT